MGLLSRIRRKSQGVVLEEGWPSTDESGFVVFDIETTGLSPNKDRIIELGLIRTDLNGNPLGYWSTLVNPQGPIGATHIHGIKQSDVAHSPTFVECVDQVLEKIKGHVLVAHNAKFDHSFLKEELARTGWHMPDIPVVCTMVESRYFLPGISRKRLVDCVEAIGIDQEVEHRALGDASLTTALFHFYLNGPVDRNRSSHLRALPLAAAAVVWPSEVGEPSSSGSTAKKTLRASTPIRMEVLRSISEIMPEDLLGDETPPDEISYAALLLTSLDDGLISDTEVAALRDCAQSFGLTDDAVTKIHEKLLLAMAREAWRDGVVSRTEVQEITECAKWLGLPVDTAKTCLQEIEDTRAAQIASRSREIPHDWSHGEPLRVGDRIVITGCNDAGRPELESRARKLGLRITGSVSGKTNLLVSDGTINGNKTADAERLGIRVVEPHVFRILLDFVQPPEISSTERTTTGSKGSSITSASVEPRRENLVCVTCGETFTRVVARGRKPHECERCKEG